MMADPALAVRVLSRPGVRVPGTWDEFELAVHAVLGQQISVREYGASGLVPSRVLKLTGTRLDSE